MNNINYLMFNFLLCYLKFMYYYLGSCYPKSIFLALPYNKILLKYVCLRVRNFSL